MQVERPGRKRHFLQGRFKIRITSAIVALGGAKLSVSADSSDADSKVVEFVIDFVDEDPRDALADEVKRQYDDGRMCKEIAENLGLYRSQVTELLHHWCRKHGETLPDGRKRRASLERKIMQPRRYELIADDAVELMRKGFPDAKIAAKLGCHDFVVAKAVRHWHRIRNLTAPTTKERRALRARLAKELVDGGQTFRAAAAELECSMVTFCKLIDLAFELEGKPRPDWRTERHSRPASPPRDDAGGGEANAA